MGCLVGVSIFGLALFSSCRCLIVDDFIQMLEGFGLAPYGGPELDAVHPEASMTTVEIIRFYGYPVDTHEVVTSDGYILEIHRIPRRSGLGRGIPVFLQHGLLGTSSHFVINGRENSLAFIMSDEGYDVWLGNFRGNRYSRRHRKISPDDPDFWEFSVDDHALGDLPATIDYVLRATDEKQLAFVGHSLGATAVLGLLSAFPTYNEKLKITVCLAPVIYTRFLRTIARAILDFVDGLKELILPISSTKEILRSSSWLRHITMGLCADRLGSWICQTILNVFCGYNEELLDRSRLPVMVTHGISGTSFNILDHFAQIFRADKPVMYDHGHARNLQRYGNVIPPSYNATSITAPVAIFWGYMDSFTDKRDLDRLAVQMSSSLKVYEMVPHDLFTHIDFIFSKNTRVHLYDRLLEVMTEVVNYVERNHS